MVELASSLDSTTKDFENQATSDAEKSAEILRKAITSDSNAKQLQSRLNESETQLNHALTLLSEFFYQASYNTYIYICNPPLIDIVCRLTRRRK